MHRFTRPLLLAVALLPLVVAPASAQMRAASLTLGAASLPISARSEASTADIPGVTYPRSAPPDLIAEDDVAAFPDAREDAPANDLPRSVIAEPTVIVPPAPPVPVVSLNLEVDLAAQRLTVIENGETKHVWPISSGAPGHPTKTGTFRPQWASRMWYSRQYDLAPMPHAVFFNGGIAFHATAATHLLGRPASHGCVRLAPENARMLYAMIHRHGYAKTEIRVFGSPKVAMIGGKTKADAPRRKRQPENASGTPFAPWPFF
jgi:lipoprotein-anchoring transpeptidase ErfK/SrfK